jgi:hypothetical protein
MSKRPPNRFSKQRFHNDYGIRNWFEKIDIKNRQIQDGLIQMFLEDFGFKGQDHAAKVAFIQNRWGKFTKYIQANHKFYLEIKYT